MKSSTKRSLSLLVSAALVIGGLMVYANLVKPEYDAIQKLRGSLIAKTNLFAEQQQIISKVKDLVSQYQGATRLQETISLALPLDEAIAQLFQQVFAISQNSGLQIQSFGLNTGPIDAVGLGNVKLNLNLSGSYASLKSFLQSLETNIRVMDVGQLNFQKDNISLSVDAYYQK